MPKPTSPSQVSELARLRREATTFKRYEDAYKIVRACARHLQRHEKRVERALAREVRGIGVSVLRRLADDMRGETDAVQTFEEVTKAIGTLIPLFSKTLFKKAPLGRKERPVLERSVPRVKVDGTLTKAALVSLARRTKSDDVETPEALRWFAKFVKTAPDPVVRRDAWRRGRALLEDAQREARGNNFLSAYYEKRLLKFEPTFFGDSAP